MKLPNQSPPTNFQDAFNRIWQHFVIEKNPPSVREHSIIKPNTVCLYRAPNGNGCAVGCMMPDEMAKRSDTLPPEVLSSEFLPSTSIRSVIARDSLVAEWFKNINPSALGDLQGIHDSIAKGTFSSFEMELVNFAQENLLTIPNANV